MYTKKYIEEVLSYYKENNISKRKTAKHFNINRKTLAAWVKGKLPHEQKHELIKSRNKHKQYQMLNVILFCPFFSRLFNMIFKVCEGVNSPS